MLGMVDDQNGREKDQEKTNSLKASPDGRPLTTSHRTETAKCQAAYGALFSRRATLRIVTHAPWEEGSITPHRHGEKEEMNVYRCYSRSHTALVLHCTDALSHAPAYPSSLMVKKRGFMTPFDPATITPPSSNIRSKSNWIHTFAAI